MTWVQRKCSGVQPCLILISSRMTDNDNVYYLQGRVQTYTQDMIDLAPWHKDTRTKTKSKTTPKDGLIQNNIIDSPVQLLFIAWGKQKLSHLAFGPSWSLGFWSPVINDLDNNRYIYQEKAMVARICKGHLNNGNKDDLLYYSKELLEPKFSISLSDKSLCSPFA